MFDVYIKDFARNGNQNDIVTAETLVQSVPSLSEGDLKLISPIVKCEMGNAESLDFSIEAGTKFYDSFLQMKTFIRIVYDGIQNGDNEHYDYNTIFFGRVLTISNDFFGNRKIRCEGPLAFLNDTSIEGQKEASRPTISVKEYLAKIISNHNTMCADPKRSFALGEVPGNYSSSTSSDQQLPNASRKFGQDSWTDTKGAIEDLRSHYGGYLRVRCPGYRVGNGFGVPVINGEAPYLVLDWMDHYFNQNENLQTIEVGKNVLDISTSTEIDNIFTVVIPIGNSKSTSYETEDGTKKSTGPKHFYIPGVEMTVPSIVSHYTKAQLDSGYHRKEHYEQAINKYGRIVKTVTFDDAENATELEAKCREWIKNNYCGEVTKFTVKAFDFRQLGDNTQRFIVGDRVRILYPIFKEDGTKENGNVIYTCLSISYDLYNPENNSYTFGIPANILTKSYGLNKQSKSTQQNSTTPKSTGGGSGNTKEVDWIDKVLEWLSQHLICYKHTVNVTQRNPLKLTMDNDHIDSIAANSMGWNNIIKSHEKGPYSGLFSDHANYFYSNESYVQAGRYTLWKCVPSTVDSDGTEAECNRILAEKRKALEAAHAPSTAIEQTLKSVRDAYWREHPSTTTWTAYQVAFEGLLTVSAIMSCNLIEYVKQEYGIDLKSFGSVKMPNNVTYTDENGTEVTIANEDGNIVTREMYSPYYNPTDEDKERGYHLVTTADGKTAVSQLDAEGEWHYTVWDPQLGTSVERSIRDLDLHTFEAADFLGTAISQGENPLAIDPDGKPHVYKFGQGIEKWADGEITTATVDGDVVRIGTTATRYSSTVAQRINGQWIHPVEFYVDTSGVGRNKAKHGTITVGDAGTAQYEAYLSKKYTPPEYLPVPGEYYSMTDEQKLTWKQDHIYNYPTNDITTFVGAGNWDTENLAIKGGVYTVVEDGKPVTYVASKQLIVGDQNTSTTVKHALVASGMLTVPQRNPDGSKKTDEHGHVLYRTITNEADLDNELSYADHSLVTQQLVAHTIYAQDIYAINGRFNTIESTYLKTVDLSSEIGKIDYLTVKNLSVVGGSSGSGILATMSSTNVSAQHYYITGSSGGEGDADNDLVDTFRKAQIDYDSSTKQYTLRFWKAGSGEYTPDEGTSLTFRSYTGGWDAAYAKVSYPTPTTDVTGTSQISITAPPKDVDGATITKSYTLMADSTDNNKENLCYWDSENSKYIIAATHYHNKYAAGWGAAVADTNITTYATYADGTELPYNASVNVSAAIKNYNGTSKSIIARTYTTKPDRYNSGWDHCADSEITIVWPNSATYSSGTINVSAAVRKSNGTSKSLGSRTYTISGTTEYVYPSNSRDFFYWYDETWIDPDHVSRKHNVWYTQYYASGSSHSSNHPATDVGYTMYYDDSRINWSHR